MSSYLIAIDVDPAWQRNDDYHNSFLIKPDAVLDQARATSEAEGLPPIAVGTAQGKFLNLVARSIGAKRILEVGTLGGYSTIWMARALPEGGELITAELDPHHVKVAQANIARAGLESKVKIMLGPAAETLKKLSSEAPFDFVFLDADKAGYPTYFQEAKRLTRKGSIIILDNVVRYGQVSDLTVTDDVHLNGVRTLLANIKNDPEVDATTISTADGRGFDGFTYCIRL
ncbi:hypothetical protein AcW1_009264 [Taiwanofungus camphoratus]|nr:hypothetical protein AcW1_009264 [Antrodia cinnamomea]